MTEDQQVEHVGEIPICPGCGLASHITHGDICSECFNRRERWLGGGGIRVVVEAGLVHETPLCPDFEDGAWALWRDEDALYHTLSPHTVAEYCQTCKYHHLTGFQSDA